MALTVSASGSGTDFALVPEGVYTGRCFKIIDLGTQEVEWQGNKKLQRKVLISWELFGKDDDGKDILMEDGRPFAVTKKYTASLDERGRLRPDLEAWRGKKFTDAELAEFDLKNVLGAYATIQVVHSEDGKYANVNSIMSFKGEKPKAVNPAVSFDIDDPNLELFETFSDRMKEQIQAAAEWKKPQEKLFNPGNTGTDEPINLDDIPF